MQVNHNPNLVQNLGDWCNHFSGTYVFVNRNNTVFPMHVEDVRSYEDIDPDDELDGAQVSFRGHMHTGTNSEDIEYFDTQASNVITGFPPLGMSDLGGKGKTKFYYYAARRQFRKSLSNGLAQSVVPHNDVANEFFVRSRRPMPRRAHLSGARLYQIMNREYSPLQEAVASLYNEDTVSRALSINFGLFATLYSPDPIIVYQQADVGFIDGEGMPYIHAQYSDLIQEFEEKVSKEVTIHE